MEKFLLIFCVVLLPTMVQGLLTKHKGTDMLVKKVLDRLIQQHGIEDPKRNEFTAIFEEITNVGDNGGKDVFINGIQSFIAAKSLDHAGFRKLKRSGGSMDDLHGRGTSTTPQPTTTQITPSE